MSTFTKINIALLATLLSTLLIFLSLPKTLIAITAIIMVATILQRPLLGLMLFAFFATFVPYTTLELGLRITLSEGMLAMTWMAVGWKLLTHEYTLKFGKTERQLIYLIVFSFIPFIVGQLTVDLPSSGLVNWLRWILNLSLLFLVPIMVANESDRDKLINALLLGSLIMMLFGLFYFIVRHQNTAAFIAFLGHLHYPHLDYTESVIGANFDRMNTTWVHPNVTGGAMALLVPFTFYYGLYVTGWRKVFALTVTVLGMMVLLFSISRGAIVSLVLVLLWLARMRAPFAAKILQIGVVLSITAVLAYPPLQSRLSTTFSSSNASTQVRLDEYKSFPEGIARHPLGIGFKSEPPVDKDLLGISNLWLNYMYKLGFIGMLMFIAVTRVWWKEVRPVADLNKLDKEHGLWVGSMSGILAALLTGIFDHYFSFATVLIALFWMMVAINLDSARRLKAQNSPLLLKKRFFV